jgi:site-specific DNA-cytosine methylase
MLRVIREIQPTWVLGENVPNIVNLALDTVLTDLESEGYEVQCFLVPACGVDAPHKRERIAILAHAIDRGGTVRRDGKLQDSASDGGPGSDNGRRTSATVTREWRKDEPRTSGVADGLRAEVHRRTDSNTDSDRLQGRVQDPLLETEFMDCSCRERERRAGTRTAEVTTVC